MRWSPLGAQPGCAPEARPPVAGGHVQQGSGFWGAHRSLFTTVRTSETNRVSLVEELGDWKLQ
jgi:hypothetical protein